MLYKYENYSICLPWCKVYSDWLIVIKKNYKIFGFFKKDSYKYIWIDKKGEYQYK